MEMKPEIKTPKFERKIEKILAEIRTRTYIDEMAAEVIKAVIQDALDEECRMLNCYYWEEYYNELYSARSSAYDEGYTAGQYEGNSAVVHLSD